MIQLEYKTVGAPAPLGDFDLNRYGQEGWHLCGIIQQTLIYYTFTRPLPVSIIHRSSLAKDGPAAPIVDYARRELAKEPHQHEPRASRRDPVVQSPDPTSQQEDA